MAAIRLFEADGSTVLKFCHHLSFGSVHVHAEFDEDNMFLYHLVMRFHCQNSYRPIIHRKPQILRHIFTDTFY